MLVFSSTHFCAKIQTQSCFSVCPSVNILSIQQEQCVNSVVTFKGHNTAWVPHWWTGTTLQWHHFWVASTIMTLHFCECLEVKNTVRQRHTLVAKPWLFYSCRYLAPLSSHPLVVFLPLLISFLNRSDDDVNNNSCSVRITLNGALEGTDSLSFCLFLWCFWSNLRLGLYKAAH